MCRHWLDVGEFLVAFAYAYDWLYDAWTPSQREAIMWSIIRLGLEKARESFDNNEWFLAVKGNWNCKSPAACRPSDSDTHHKASQTAVSLRDLLPSFMKTQQELLSKSSVLLLTALGVIVRKLYMKMGRGQKHRITGK